MKLAYSSSAESEKSRHAAVEIFNELLFANLTYSEIGEALLLVREMLDARTRPVIADEDLKG